MGYLYSIIRKAKIRPMAAKLTLAFLLLVAYTHAQATVLVEGVRIWPAPDNTRLVFDISSQVQFKYKILPAPERFFIDLSNTTINTQLANIPLENSPIQAMRSGKQTGNITRLVLDLKQKVTAKVFSLPPNETYGHRLVVDLFYNQGEFTQSESTGAQQSTASSTQTIVKSVDTIDNQRDIIVAIDAGHGGEDPGALGPKYKGKKLQEKHVVLAISKYVRDEINKLKGFKAILIRDGDYYISLRKRTQIARDANADLFLSIHADAFKNKKAKGASVWVLSQSGASSEMGRWLAQKENSADLIGGIRGVSLDDKEEDLAKTLLDLSMTHSQSTSNGVAETIYGKMSDFAHMHKNHVERAGFLVLKSPDIPSALIETGFISNPGEAAKLRTTAYQKKMAKAIASGVKRYFYDNPPSNSYVAGLVEARQQQIVYKVVKGDTLSGIAVRYGTSISQLRKTNNMTSKSVLRIGQELVIPPR